MWVYDFDEDDEGCVRLYVNTDVPYSIEEVERLAEMIDRVEDGGQQEGLSQSPTL